MYRFTNVSLDPIYEKYGTDLSALSQQQLEEICRDPLVNIVPAYEYAKDNKQKIIGFLKFDTVEEIEKRYTFSTYMEPTYWDARHFEKAKEARLDERNAANVYGNQMYEYYSKLKLGFFNLKPKQYVDIDVSDRFIVDYFLHKPIHKDINGRVYIKVEDLDKKTDLEAASIKIEEDNKAKADALEAFDPKSPMDKEFIPESVNNTKELAKIAFAMGFRKAYSSGREAIIKYIKEQQAKNDKSGN
jgi:hypothetical protein